MKYIKYLLLIVLFPVNVLAFQLSCQNNVNAGDDLTCTIFGPEYCSDLKLELVLPEGFSYKSEKVGKNYNKTGNGINLSYTGNGIHEDVVSVITIKTDKSLTGTYNIELKNIEYKYTSNDEFTKANNLSKSVNIKEPATTTTKPTTTIKANANLILTLDVNDGDGENQSLSCTPSNGACVINLSTASSPTKEGYTFKGWGANKECTQGENDNYEIKANTTLYACWIQNGASTIPYLESLTIDNYPFVFSKFKFEYEINVGDDVIDTNNLNINAKAVSNTATIDILKPETLSEGVNVIKVTVNDNGNTSEYIININKGSFTQTLLLSDLSIEGYNLNFDPNVYEYTLNISSTTKNLNITANPLNINSTVEIIGNEALKNGSQIIIRVTSLSEETQDYIINITTTSFIKENLNKILAALGIILMFIIYFIVNAIRKRNNNGTNKKEVKPKKEKKIKVKKNKKENLTPSKEPIETLETL